MEKHGDKKDTAFTLVVAPAARFRFHENLATPGPAPFRRPDPALGQLKSAAGPVFDWNGEAWVQPADDADGDSEAPGPEGDEDTLDWHAAATQTLAARQRRAEAAFDELAEALDQCDLVSASRAASVAKKAVATFSDHHNLYRLGSVDARSDGLSEITGQIARHGMLCDQAELVAAFRAKQEEASTAAAPAAPIKPAASTTSSPPTRGRRVNPVLQMLLAGTRDPECPLSVIRGHQDVLEMLWLEVIQMYADQLDTTSPAYSILRRAPLTFPPSQGLQVNMMPFKLKDVTSLPAECQQWWPIISTCTSYLSEQDLVADDNGAAIGYLTVDERDTGGGASHRRGGLHTESPGSSFVMGSGDPVREAPYYHGWGIGMRLGDRKLGGGIFMSSNVSDSTAVYSASVVRPQDADDPKAAAGMIGQLGDCEHLRPAVAHTRRMLGANELLWMTDMSLHESLPIAKPVHRQYFRLVTRNIGAWYEHHSTPNPLKVTPPPCVRIITTSKFGDESDGNPAPSKWQWRSDDAPSRWSTGWVDMNPATSAQLEQAHSTGLASASYDVAGRQYNVDFTRNVQTRADNPRLQRGVRRMLTEAALTIKWESAGLTSALQHECAKPAEEEEPYEEELDMGGEDDWKFFE